MSQRKDLRHPWYVDTRLIFYRYGPAGQGGLQDVPDDLGRRGFTRDEED